MKIEKNLIRDKLIERLEGYQTLKVWNRFRLYGKQQKFADHVLNAYNSPDYLRLQNFGTDYMGETIYLADEQGGGVGFFAELGVTLIKLYFADVRGFTPYVSWGENYLYYEPDGIEGEKNAFLHYFAPVSHVNNVEHASFVIKSEMSHYEWVKNLYHAVSYDVSEEYVNAMAAMLRKYIRYNEKTKKYLAEEEKKLLGNVKTLGVHYRGTDFRKQYNNHPVAVRLEQAIEEVRKLLAEKNYKQIFLATDEEAAVREFQKAFGNLVKVYTDTFRDTIGGDSIAFSKSERNHHKYLLGLEVLRDEYTLVQCEGLVCGYSNVTFMARIMRRGWMGQEYEDYVLINNGINHNQNNFWESGHAPK